MMYNGRINSEHQPLVQDCGYEGASQKDLAHCLGHKSPWEERFGKPLFLQLSLICKFTINVNSSLFFIFKPMIIAAIASKILT